MAKEAPGPSRKHAPSGGKKDERNHPPKRSQASADGNRPLQNLGVRIPKLLKYPVEDGNNLELQEAENDQPIEHHEGKVKQPAADGIPLALCAGRDLAEQPADGRGACS